MQTRVIGVRREIDADLVLQREEIDVIQPVLRGVGADLLLPFVVPVRPDAGGLDQDKPGAVLFTERLDLAEILPAGFSDVGILQDGDGRKRTSRRTPTSPGRWPPPLSTVCRAGTSAPASSTSRPTPRNIAA